MASTAIVWLRRDLRIHDHPPLVAALAAHDRVVPVYVLDPVLLTGRFASQPRTAFLLDCLRELDGGDPVAADCRGRARDGEIGELGFGGRHDHHGRARTPAGP